MNQTLKGLIGFVILVLVALWSPWVSWNIDWYALIGLDTPDSISALQIISLSGDYNIYIDDQRFEMEKIDSPFFIADIDPGEHLVRIERETEIDGAYESFSKLIVFPENGEVVISVNIGPEKVFSEWHVIVPSVKTQDTDLTTINFNTNTEDPNLLVGSLPVAVIDNKGFTEVDLNSQKTVTISQSGYESQTFTLFPEDQSERDALEKFDFTIDVHLMLQPVFVE